MTPEYVARCVWLFQDSAVPWYQVAEGRHVESIIELLITGAENYNRYERLHHITDIDNVFKVCLHATLLTNRCNQMSLLKQI